jgi:hypothetical protein
VSQGKKFSFHAGAAAVCTAALLLFAAPADAFARDRDHGRRSHAAQRIENDFECIVHTVYGEGNNMSESEQATIANGIVISARKNGRSVCGEVRARYSARYATNAPTNKSSPSVERAVNNVLHEGATDVPEAYKKAVEFRSAAAPLLSKKGLILIGQITRGKTTHSGGNRYYKWNYSVQPNPYGLVKGNRGPI